MQDWTTGGAARLVSIVAVVALAGCATPARNVSRVSRSSGHEVAAENRAAAQREAIRLISLVRLPRGAKELDAPPPALREPATGVLAASSVVRRASFWSVPMSFSSTYGWLRMHPPAGLRETTSESAGASRQIRTVGIGYADTHPSVAWQNAELDFGLASGGRRNSYVRTDAVVPWLDTTPLPDHARGRRIHVDVADSCPGTDEGITGVRNDASADLSRQLLPNRAPRAALICRYGVDGTAFTLRSRRVLDSSAARDLLGDVRRVPLTHLENAVTHCPMDDGAAAVVAFAYARGPDVDLWVRLAGCGGISDGFITSGTGTFPSLNRRG